MSITVDDSQGIQSDKCTLVLDDRNYKLEWSEKGKSIVVSMGYKETGLMEMGTFEIDEVRHKGIPSRYPRNQCQCSNAR